MVNRKVPYNKGGIEKLPNDKPVVYKIKTGAGKPNYAGIAIRGRVQDRIREHIGEVPGETVEIEQFNSIQDARKKEEKVIRINKPKYNEQGK